MISRILQYIRGYLCIRVAGYSAERFLNACSHRGIQLWNVRSIRNTYEMNISVRGFRQIKPIVRKTGAKVVIVKRFGLPFFLQRYRRRKLFFAGAGLCLLLIYILSKFVWSIDIRGNLTRTDETLLEFLDTKNIRNGMKISKVDCGEIVKDIRKEYDDIIWVSASIEGTKLIIQVKENQDSAASEDKSGETKGEPVDIVADMDCIVTSIITRKGVPQVKEGQQIKTGDILVSGQVPVSNDAGEIIDYQYQESDADIRGQTTVAYQDSQELTYEVKEFSAVEKKEYYIRIGDFRVSLGGIKNKYENFEQYSQEKQLKLFENFYLPFSFGSRRAVPYSAIIKTYDEKEIQRMLSERFLRYCEDLEKKGVEIIQNDVKIYTGSEKAEARGTLTVNMPIGTCKPAQLMELPDMAEENEHSGEETDGNDGGNN